MVKEKYYILNLLRGLSALFVLFYHFFVFFFSHQSMSADLLCIAPINLTEPFYLKIFGDFPLNIGHLGVAFFFLISGFLIQPSLERYASLKSFLIHKVLRLWPSYALCFFLGLLFVFVFYAFQGASFPYAADHLFAYFFWVRDIFHYPFIDGAVWSLEIQIKFYILAGLIWSFGKKNFLDKMCFFIIFSSLFVYGLYTLFNGEDMQWFSLVILARRNLKYFILIFLGTCIYSLYKKQISIQKAVCLGAILIACFISPLFASSDFAKTVSYLLSVFVFSYLLLFHGEVTKKTGIFSRLINWVSDVSYPLYIGHVLPGYTIMYFMIDNGLSIYLGILVALLYVFVMAEIVHNRIEKFFTNMSGKILLYREKSTLLSTR